MEAGILIFGGTTEGRELAQWLVERGHIPTVSVATDYGKQLLSPSVPVLCGRMERVQMADCITQKGFSLVIDATHPYAAQASDNIRTACEDAGVEYVRLLRQAGKVEGDVQVDSTAQAAEFLRETTGNILLTTGSKELEAFACVEDYAQRIYPRVLPTVEVLQKCLELGYAGSHIIAMQGPFTRACNAALMQQYEIRWMVTKASGAPGGFADKIAAAKDAGAKVMVIGRPRQEQGMDMKQVQQMLMQRLYLSVQEKEEERPTRYFPMFVDLQGKEVLVIGGGNIAKRRINTLRQFGCHITVVAPKAEILPDGVEWKQRTWKPEDCRGKALVVAATNDRAVNHAAEQVCREWNIPISVADCKEECSFYFPAVAIKGSVVGGITASGTDHSLTRQMAQQVREAWGIAPQQGKEQA